MKNKISAFALAAVLFTGCSLDEYPYGFYSERNYYKTEADAQSATMYIYDAINYIEYSRAIVFLGGMNTDELNPKGDATQSTKDLDSWSQNNFRSNVTMGNFFKYSYITINRANAVIKNVPGMSIDEGLRNRFTGEAYFMRGYSYFNLARNFGRVPIHLDVVQTLDDTQAGLPASLDEMWGYIIEDFKKAAELLPYYAKPETGRVDRAAAEGFLAKTYLYLASAKEYGVPQYKDMSLNVDDYYAKAAEAAGKVVDNPAQTTYHFDDDLMHIYDVNYPDGPEHIFIMSMDRTGESEGQYSKISKMYIPYISGGTVYLKQGDTDVMIPSHDGWSEYQTNIDFYNSYETGDLRKDWLICKEVYDASGAVTASYPGGGLSYPFCRKFIDPGFNGDKTSTKPYLFRYSDAALIYAEAAGPTDKAYALVNHIRNRAGLGDLTPGLSKADFRKAVIKERVYELAFEGNITYDLRRTGLLHTVAAVVGQGITNEEDILFYPIPSIETDLNPNIQQ
ncbi:MAG: RagB/SusD family nutrient uptake outer membrane protein [Bacteroidales bacterium]|nr:RagB/SusD family nutrient uptake outer membrane protein [Bacteroidales bacterium]